MYYIFTNKPGQKSLTFNPIINSLFYLNCDTENRRDIETQVYKNNNNFMMNKKLSDGIWFVRRGQTSVELI